MALHALRRKHALQLLELPFRPFLCHRLEAEALQTAGPSLHGYVRDFHEGTGLGNDGDSIVRKSHDGGTVMKDKDESEGSSRSGKSSEGDVGYIRSTSGAEASCSQSVTPKLSSRAWLNHSQSRGADAFSYFKGLLTPLPTGGRTWEMASAPHLGSFRNQLGSSRAYNMDRWAIEETASTEGQQQNRQAEGWWPFSAYSLGLMPPTEGHRGILTILRWQGPILSKGALAVDATTHCGILCNSRQIPSAKPWRGGHLCSYGVTGEKV